VTSDLPIAVASLIGGYALRVVWPRRRAADAPPPGLDPASAMRPEDASDPLSRLREVLELLPEPMLLLDRHGSMRHANLAAREPFGDVLGALLRHPALGDAVRGLHGDTVVTTIVKMDVPVRRVLRLSLKALPEAFHGLLILSLSDHTQQAVLDRMREDFIANASHELRTPLASLIGFIDTLLGPAADDPPAQKRFLGIMQAQAARMRRLIDNLMNLSRIQMVEHERPRERMALSEVAAHVAGEFEPLMEARGVALVLELADGLPPVRGDADQIAQIVQNLLDNALKYAAGRIVLSVRIAQGGTWPAAPGQVLAVSDDGPGIAAHHLPRLTERFYRTEEGNAGKAGSGLGLAIVKHIVGRHAGRLQIESIEGKGSLFSIWLPCPTVMKMSA